MIADKPKVAFYWCASCGGCEEAVLDLSTRLLEVLDAVEIAFWPVALDYKRQDVEAMPDRSLFAAFINGAVRTTEQEEMAELLRRKSKTVVAFGTCAQLGGVPGLANAYERQDVFEAVYRHNATTENLSGTLPTTSTHFENTELKLPWFYSSVRPLDAVIEVDYYIPGCPPVPEMVEIAIHVLLGENPPPKRSTLAPDRALCEECPRRDSKPQDLAFSKFKRPHETLIDESCCLLAQGIVCLGPATRGGCGSACVSGNMPCTGCFGPTSRLKDQGAKLISAIASSIDSSDEKEIDRILDGIPDLIGTFYRYSLPASLLHRRRFPSTRS